MHIILQTISDKSAALRDQSDLDSPERSICEQSVRAQLFPSSAELLKMHKGTSTVSLRVCVLEVKVYLSPSVLSLVSKREGGKERPRGGESDRERGGRIIISNLFFVDCVD